MDKRYYTLFILKNDASRSRQFSIPVGLFKAVCASCAVLFIALSFVIYDYARLKENSYELSSLKNETAGQRIELQGFAEKIKDLEVQLAKLNLFDKKLRIIANIEEPKGMAHADQIMGIGGGTSAEDEQFVNTPKAKVKELVNQMRSDINGVEEGARAQENSFTELQGYLMQQSSMLAATPSIWPSRGWVTSGFGERVSPFTGFQQMHNGLDIANRAGTPVVAPANGIVVGAGRDTGLGKAVTISHGYGVKTTYGHLSELFVRVGQKVKRGERIASIGNTGRSTGPHLHYEVSLNGISVNPSKYILN